MKVVGSLSAISVTQAIPAYSGTYTPNHHIHADATTSGIFSKTGVNSNKYQVDGASSGTYSGTYSTLSINFGSGTKLRPASRSCVFCIRY